MKKYRVSLQGTFCRDVFLEAESAEAAKAKAAEADYDEEDWCPGEGHPSRVTVVVETDDAWEER
jgi:hypothetical protein